MASLVPLLCAPIASAKNTQVDFWNPAAPGFEYPEDILNLTHLEGREDFGVAFAGGGLRGMALAHGAFRALWEAKVTEQAKYMMVSSGSVWFGVPLYFQTLDDIGQFLGKSMEPEDLTGKSLVGENAGTFITRLNASIFTQYPKGFDPDAESVEVQDEDDEWSRISRLKPELEAQSSGWPATVIAIIEAVVGDIFELIDIITKCSLGITSICTCVFDSIGVLLLPDYIIETFWTMLTEGGMKSFGLVDSGSTWCHPTQLNATRAKLGPETRIYESQDVKYNLPFLVSQASVIYFESGTDQEKDPLIAAPLENTLLYSGVPVSPTGPGVYVEPFATSSKAHKAVPNSSYATVAASRQLDALNSGGLTEWASYSTAIVAAWQIRPTLDFIGLVSDCAKTRAEKLAPTNWLWSPSDVGKLGVPKNHKMPVGDGGVYDDIGHLPLLRRKFKKMLLFDHSAIPPDTADLPGPDKVTLEANVYLKAAFGAKGGLDPPNPAGSPNPVMAENYLTVFEPSEFQPLWEKMQALKEARKPIVVRGNFTVVDNPHFGIEGGWTVEITWVVLTPVNEFFQALPEKTQKQLLKKDYFPNYGATDPTSYMELSALSQYASWVTRRSVLQEVEDMLRSNQGPALV